MFGEPDFICSHYHMFTLGISYQIKQRWEPTKGVEAAKKFGFWSRFVGPRAIWTNHGPRSILFPGEDPRGGSAFHPTLKTNKLGFPLALCCQPRAPAGAVKRAQIFHAKLSDPGFHAQIASTHRCSSPKEYPKNNQVFDLSPHHI
jgi:hypothetical protein